MALKVKASTTYLNPSVKDIVLWLDRVNILAIIKMIGCYYDNWSCIKLFSKIMHLLKRTIDVRDGTGRVKNVFYV